jgi:hypothetical protein
VPLASIITPQRIGLAIEQFEITMISSNQI